MVTHMNGLFAAVIAFILSAVSILTGKMGNTPKMPAAGVNVPIEATTEVATPATQLVPTAPTQVISTGTNMNDLRYPNSTVLSQNGGTLLLSSDDSETTITDWYKEKIRELGMNNKSFVTTNTNGDVLNKLVGGNGKAEVRVTITKTTNDTLTKIEVIY